MQSNGELLNEKANVKKGVWLSGIEIGTELLTLTFEVFWCRITEAPYLKFYMKRVVLNQIVVLLFLLFATSLSHSAQSQCLITTVEGVQINGRGFRKGYKVLVSTDKQWIEAKRTSSGFIIPKEVKNEENIDVRVIVGKYQLDFVNVHISKFDATWSIGLDDTPPFSDEYVSPEEGQNLKRIYYINFKSRIGLDTVLLIKETR